MTSLPKFPLALKVLWFSPIAVLCFLIAVFLLPPEKSPHAELSILYLTGAAASLLAVAAVGTTVWAARGLLQSQDRCSDFPPDSRPKCK